MSQPALTAVAGSPLLSGFTPQDLAELGRYLDYRKFVPGAAIFLENMEGEYMYLVLSGTVKISRMLHEGKEKVLAVLGPEDTFGELALVDNARRESTARVLEEAQLALFSRDHYLALCREVPRVALKLTINILRIFSRRVRSTADDYKAMLHLLDTTGG